MSRSKTLGFLKDHCRICNRDFGVFLDIFRSLENRKYYKEIEECLSVKVSQQDNVSLKVCHRCVYNLKLCSEFVDQFNTNHHQLRTCPVMGSLCYFCLRNNCVLYDIEKHADEDKCTVCKIEKCFSSKVPAGLNATCKLCLSCAYRLDILYELRETAFKTQQLHVKTFEKISPKAVQERNTNSRNNHLSHVKNYGIAELPKQNINIHDISDKRSGVKSFKEMPLDSKKKSVMKGFKEIKMGTRRNQSGKKVTEGQLQCSIKLIDVMKVDRSKRKRSESSGDTNVEKFIKVEDQQMKTSRVAAAKNKSNSPIKRESISPRKTPEKTHTQISLRTPVKSNAVSLRRSPVRNSPRSPKTPVSTRSLRRTPVRNNNQSPAPNPIKSEPLTPTRTPVKTIIESRKKTPERLTVNSSGRSEGSQAKKKETPKLNVKPTPTIGSKALKGKFENSEMSRKIRPLAKSRSVKTKPKSKKTVSPKNSSKFNCSVCNATFSKKVNMKMHELSHQSKMPILVLRRCGDFVANIKSEVTGESSLVSKKFPEESSSQTVETFQDQKASISKAVDKETSNEKVENMEVCQDDLPAHDLSESKSHVNIKKEKESESVENKNSASNNVSENNEEQLAIKMSPVKESDRQEKPKENVNETENDNSSNPEEESIEIKNNEESTSRGEIESINEDNPQTPVKTEINNSQEEQTEERTDTNGDQDEERTDTNEEQDEEKTDTNEEQDEEKTDTNEEQDEEKTDTNEEQDEEKTDTNEEQDEEKPDTNEEQDEKNPDTNEEQDEERTDTNEAVGLDGDGIENAGNVATASVEEQIAKGSNEGDEATNTQGKDKIDESEEQTV